ncbi:hypothetical protein G6F40_016980 [Rhizopus arrhizus]|nr:hypothetical protein G6F40_016980 [Rhizopus arrhizus]
MPKPAAEARLRLVMAGGALAPRRALLQSAGSAAAAIAQGTANWRAHGCTPEHHAALAGRRPSPPPGLHRPGLSSPLAGSTQPTAGAVRGR